LGEQNAGPKSGGKGLRSLVLKNSEGSARNTKNVKTFLESKKLSVPKNLREKKKAGRTRSLCEDYFKNSRQAHVGKNSHERKLGRRRKVVVAGILSDLPPPDVIRGRRVPD